MQSASKYSFCGIDKTNVLFITLDCCRYDTFRLARLPFIKSLGRYAKAKTHGTYTLPAHMSFFAGYLPTAYGSTAPYYDPAVKQLWRLKSGRKRDIKTVGIMLDGKNILEGYKNLGFTIVGSGGVRWFRNPLLTKDFYKFLFYSPKIEKDIFSKRAQTDFSLNHLDEILKELKDQERNNFFLFINSSETHAPYDFGEGLYSKEVRAIIEQAKPIWGCKSGSVKNILVEKSDLKKLHEAQVWALESIDKKIEKLISQLKKPLLIVICGDHGECFGEGLNWGHGYPFDPVMSVPLLISFIN